MIASNQPKLRLSWHKPRGCYRKYYGGQTYYLRGDNSRQETQANYEAALAEWFMKKQSLDQQAREAGIARRVSKTVELIEEFTSDLRNGANKKLATLGLPTMAAPKLTTRPLVDSATMFMDDLRARAERGELSVGRYERVGNYITTFLASVGDDTDSNAINEMTLQAFRKDITGRIGNGKNDEISGYSARYTLQTAASFVDWLWRSKLLMERPRNIESFKKVKVAKSPVKFFTVEQIKSIWGACEDDKQRLYVALAINTAMNQADIAKLTPSNLEPPFLITRREKTGVVACWKLWPMTWKLIESCKRRGVKKPTDLLFLTRDGRPLVERGFRKDGRTFKNDAIRQTFNRLLADVGIDGSFVMLRKTVATVLKSKGYGDVVQFFLAHDNDALFISNGVVSKEPSGDSVAERFYIGHEAKVHALKNHPRLLEALAMLEREFGIAVSRDVS